MAQNQQQVSLPAGGWTQITNADVTNITFQVVNDAVFIRFTTDETQPAASLIGLRYERTTTMTNEGELNKPLSDLTNLGAADRVWARPVSSKRGTSIYVDHADA